jgi:hypothetical protein
MDEDLERLLDLAIANKPASQSPFTDIGKLKAELTQCPAWVLDRFKKELKTRKDFEAKLRDVNRSQRYDMQTFESWKATAQKTFDDQQAASEAAWKEKVDKLEAQLKQEKDTLLTSGAEQQRERDKGFLLTLSHKDKEIEDLNKEIDSLRKVVCILQLFRTLPS